MPGKGASHICLDSWIDIESSEEFSPLPAPESPRLNPDLEPLRNFFAEWIRLPPETRDTLAELISNPYATLSEIAQKQGVSVQAISYRLKKAKSTMPILESAISQGSSRKSA